MIYPLFISMDGLLAIKPPIRYVVKPTSWTSFELEFIDKLNFVVGLSI